MAKEERIIEVDDKTIQTFLATYSADMIAGKEARLKGIAEFEDKLYACVGTSGTGEESPAECEMVEVILKEEWEKTTYTYPDKSAAVRADEDKRGEFYLGIQVAYKKKKYVLGNAFTAILKGSRPAAKPKVEVRVKRENFTAMAKCTFKEEETRDMAKDMARTVGLLASLDDEKKTIVSEYTAKINKAQAEVNELARKLVTGYEFRMVEHERVYDFNGMSIYILRLDSGECTEERTMTGQEAQMDMGFHKEENDYEVYAGGSTEEGEGPEVDAEYAEGEEAEEPLEEGQEVPEAESTLSSTFPTEYEEDKTAEGGDANDRS